MKSDLSLKPATHADQLLAVEVFSELLVSTDTRQLGQKLTEQLRELTGARTVMLIKHGEATASHEPVHVCPARRTALFAADELRQFCPDCTPGELPCRTEELPPAHPLRALLSRVGVESLLRFPLRAGGELVATILLFDLPGLDRIDETEKIVAHLSPVMALALRNSFANERIAQQTRELELHTLELEQHVAARTAELAAANQSLGDSRLAALNLMEDAIAARQRAEQTTGALQKEMAERQRTEAALQESQTLLESITQSTSDAIYLKDTQGRYLVFNAAASRFVGKPSEAVLGKDDTALFPPDQARQVMTGDRQVMASGSLQTCEELVTTNVGLITFLTTKGPIRDAQGEIIGLFGIARDITERKRAEAERQKFVMLADSSSEFIGMCDLDLKPLYVNPAGLRMVGLPDLAAASQVKVQDYYFPEDQRFIAEEFFPRVLREGHGDVEIRLRHFQTGEPIWMIYSLFSVHDASGTAVGWATVSRDITERKQAEAALRRSARELEERNDELQRFTYTVSHDLKSPLVTIQTFAGYLERDAQKQDTAQMEKDLKFVRGAADKMSRLLNELLDLSRVGRKMNPFVAMPLQTVVQEALALVAGRIAERGVQIQVAAEPFVLFGDRSRLVEVFQNLVDNAVKFMGDQPEPRVEIGAEQAEEGPVFFVRDNGGGIDPRHQGKLFGLFEKLDPRGEGTGVGLALVKRIVEVHGGRVWVESAGLGQGATFRFTLAGPGQSGPKAPPTPPV